MSGPAAKSKQLADKIESKADKFRQGTPLPDEAGLKGYPVKYFERDPRDEYMETRQALAANPGLRGRFGTDLPVGEKEIQYLQDQKTKEEKIIFDTWKYKTFQPGSDPVRQKYFEKIDPSWYKEREQEIERVFAQIEKLALIALHSVRTPEDMVLLYGINSGRIPIPRWQDYMPGEAFGRVVGAGDVRPEYITQGYWNPRRAMITHQPSTGIPNIYGASPLNMTFASPSRLDNTGGDNWKGQRDTVAFYRGLPNL